MTLEEAIKHCEEKACNNTECAAEHKQLAEWLKELMNLQHLADARKKMDDSSEIPKDLEEAAEAEEDRVIEEVEKDDRGCPYISSTHVYNAFVRGAKWGGEKMVKKVVKWLKETGANNLYISMFQRDMEEKK